MGTIIKVDLTTFTEIAVSLQKLSDAWLKCVTIMVDDEGQQDLALAAEQVTKALDEVTALVTAAYHADAAEVGPSDPRFLQ